MCSVDPDEIVEMTRATDGLDISSGDILCRRCNDGKAVVVLRMKDAYCRECFLSYFVHKFRSTIGKSKQIRPGDRVLIATSGGLSSAALLHLIREGLDETSHKKLRFEPAFLYIDESCLSNDPDTGTQFLHEICSQVVVRNFPCYVTSLEWIMSTQPSLPVLFAKDGTTGLDKNPELKELLRQLISSCKSDSGRQDLLEQLRREVLYQCVDSLGYHKIFLADNATTLSVCILANVAMGRGSQLADRVHFKARHKDIEVYRPMREILQNEIQYYVSLHNVATIQAPTLKLKGQSIIKCTEDFVMGLQKEFPATIPTIFRTGDKLVSTSASISECSTPDLNGYAGRDEGYGFTNTLCAMCGLQIDTLKGEASAVHATVISQKLSCIGAPGEISQKELICGNAKAKEVAEKASNSTSDVLPPINSSVPKSDALNGCCTKDSADRSSDSCCGSQGSCCNSSNKSALRDHVTSNEISKNALESYLCYGCRIIVRELEEVTHLPTKVRGSISEQERRKQMREQIQDFLL